MKSMGEMAFLGGLILSLLVGIASGFLGSMLPLAFGILAVLGLVVGFLNINEKEATPFLVAAIAMLLATTALDPVLSLISAVLGSAGMTVVLWFKGFMAAIAVFIAPAAFLVAIKSVYSMAKDN